MMGHPICPRCKSKNIVKYKRHFTCLICGADFFHIDWEKPKKPIWSVS